MVVELDFEVSGQKQIARRLERFEKNLKDARPAFREMHESFLKIEKRQFNTEGRSGSGGWAPLSEKYVKRKQWMLNTKRIVGGWPARDARVLHLTRRLELSLTQAKNYQHINRTTKDQASFGTTVPYAAVHQNPKASNPIKKRPPIELTEANKKAWVKILQKHLIESTLR